MRESIILNVVIAAVMLILYSTPPIISAAPCALEFTDERSSCELSACVINEDEGMKRTGVLVIAHGSPNEAWCAPVREVVRRVSPELPCPVELGFLEFVPNETINMAVERLDERNVTKIIAVPLFISSDSGHIEEIKYVLGLREEPPEHESLTFIEGKPVKRSVFAANGKCVIRYESLERADLSANVVGVAAEEELTPVNTTAEIVLTSALDNSSLLAQTLAENAESLISNAENETVVFISHGCFNTSHFEKWIEYHESLAEQIRLILRYGKEIPIEDVRFGFIHLPEMDNETVHPELEMRAVVENVSRNSTPVVVANMVSVGFFTKRYIPMRLENLTYKYNGSKALTPHDNIVKWIEMSALREIRTFFLHIYENETLLNITIEEVGEHHGDICPCVAAAFRASQIALSFYRFPMRCDIDVISAHPSKGHKDTFEYIFGEGHLKVESPSDILNLSAENYAYSFIQQSSGTEVRVKAKEDIFPERFFEMRKRCKTGIASAEEKKAFKYAKEDLKNAFLYLPEGRVFYVKIISIARVPAVERCGILILALAFIAIMQIRRR